MGMQQEYHWNMLGMLWEYSKHSMQYHGTILGIVSECYGSIMAMLWERSGNTLGILCKYYGSTMGVAWLHRKTIGISWEYLRNSTRILCEY